MHLIEVRPMSEQYKGKMTLLNKTEAKLKSLLNPRQRNDNKKAKNARIYVSFLKTLSWSSLGFLILYLLTGTWGISITFTGIRTVLYFIHERLWEHRNNSFHNLPF